VNTALGLIGVVVLIALNGYFVAAEFAYVSVRRAQLEAHERADAKRVERALAIVKRLSFMLSGAQLGITIMSVIIGFIAEPSIGQAIEPLMEWIGIGESARQPIALVLAFVIATAAQMLFGELFPKNLSIARAEGVSLALATTTALYTRIAAPVIRLFDNSANALLRLFGIEAIEELHGGVTSDEFDFIVEESVREGRLTPQQAELLSRSIEFPMLDAADAMRHRRNVMTVSSQATGWELRTVAGAVHSRLPVVDENGDRDEVVGVVELRTCWRSRSSDAMTCASWTSCASRSSCPSSSPCPTCWNGCSSTSRRWPSSWTSSGSLQASSPTRIWPKNSSARSMTSTTRSPSR